MTKNFITILLAVSLLLPPAAAVAESTGDLPELWCAVIESFECAPGTECHRGLPESINFPRIIKIDFKKKIIIDDQFGESVRTTMIDKLQQMDGKLILNGTQEGMGWTMVINQTNGDLTLSATDDQFGFIVFGACTPR